MVTPLEVEFGEGGIGEINGTPQEGGSHSNVPEFLTDRSEDQQNGAT